MGHAAMSLVVARPTTRPQLLPSAQKTFLSTSSHMNNHLFTFVTAKRNGILLSMAERHYGNQLMAMGFEDP